MRLGNCSGCNHLVGRTQEWKFILNETEPPGLYRIAEVRPRERRDLAGSTGYARAHRDLEKHLAAWWAW